MSSCMRAPELDFGSNPTHDIASHSLFPSSGIRMPPTRRVVLYRLMRRVVRMPRAVPERVRCRVPRRVQMLPHRAVQCEYTIVFGVDVVIGGGNDDGNGVGLRTANEGRDNVSSIQVGGNGR